MARCGCASNVCSCTINAGLGSTVSGSGTPTDPYVISTTPTVLTVRDTASVDLTLTGNGTAQAPYLLAADLAQEPTGGAGAPTGSVLDFAGDTAPIGWLLCQGQAVARVEFSVLFAVIGTKYGAGDGSTTYNLPDLRSRVTLGAGAGTGLTNRVIGTKGGAQDGAVISHGHGSHDHGTHGHATHEHGYTGTVSADHVHSGGTGYENTDHTHGIAFKYTGNTATGASSSTYRITEINNVPNGAGTAAQVYLGGITANHAHAFSTGGISANHQHAVGAVGVPAAAVPATAVAAAGVGATDTNMMPWIAMNKMIKT